MEPIVFWDRARGRTDTEKVYGGKWVKWLYGSRSGRFLADGLLSGRLVSQLYGAYQASSRSSRKVEPFVRDFDIRMDEFEAGPFSNFNDFFIRKFRPGMRPFVADGQMPAPAEARYLGYERVAPDEIFPVKGKHLSAQALLGSAEKARAFDGGPLLIARLCPVDYHRYHYPDDGRTLDSYTVHGRLHSVNPAALVYRSEIFATNERRVALLETAQFGKLAYVEVGAMCVGKIVQSFDERRPFRRGDEKGYFLFGASTVILLGEPGRWRPDPVILEQTSKHRRETYVRLGEIVAAQ